MSCFALSGQGMAADWYVDSRFPRPAPYNGEEWQTAYFSLKAALDNAVPGDVIHVAGAGPDNLLAPPYEPAPGIGETAREASFKLKPGVTILGSYKGYDGLDDGTQNERDRDQYETILTGDLDGDGILNAGNSYHVVTALDPEIKSTTVLDGVTITGGYADGADIEDKNRGAGLFALDCSPIIRNCTFRENAVEQNGGQSGGPALCVRFEAGLPFDAEGDPIEWMLVENCKIYSNTAMRNGGGAMVYIASNDLPGAIAFVSCEFTDNVARGEFQGDGCGGALYIEHGNDSPDDWQVVDVVNSTFHRNFAPIAGGAISDKAHGRVRLTVVNCLLTENGVNPVPEDPPTNHGGAIGMGVGLSLDVINSTFSLNEASNLASAIYWQDGFYDRVCGIFNAILWGDTGPAEIYNSGLITSMTVDHSLVQGGGSGMGYQWTNSITDDPEFLDAATDFRLKASSPAANEGLDTLSAG